VVVFGTGKQTRDFIYIDDVVDALVASSQSEDLDGAVINVGSGQEMSIEGLVQKIAAAAGKTISPLLNEGESSGPSRLVADLTLARTLLDFDPKVDIDRGLELFLERDDRFSKMSG
jgi:UDP-glucose 4-epimerase